jgi:HlyD family secretion protein
MANVLKILRAQLGWIILGVVALAGAGGWWWYEQYQAEQARLAELAALRTETLTRGDLVATVSATGSLYPNGQANLAFLVPGTVQEVLVSAGDEVKAGQLLARLDDADLQLAVSQAEDALAIAELRQKILLAGPTEDDIAVAKANLRAANASAADASRGAGPQEAEIAKLQYDNASEEFRKLNDQYNQLAQLAKDHPQFAPPQSALDSLKLTQENAYFQAEIARLQWEQAKKPGDPGSVTLAYARIAQAKAQLDQLLAGPTDLQKQQAALAVAQAQLALEQAQERAARVELRAPFAGVVSVVNAKVGEPASGPVITLLDIRRFQLDVTVNEVDVTQLSNGQPVSVTVDALPDLPLSGTVSRIAPTAVVVGGAVNYTVRVTLAQSAAALRSGMSATVQVTIAEVRDVVLAPNWAIRRDRRSGQAFLSVRGADGLPHEVQIETGLRGDDYTEIRSGAAAGDEAAISTVRENLFDDN